MKPLLVIVLDRHLSPTRQHLNLLIRLSHKLPEHSLQVRLLHGKLDRPEGVSGQDVGFVEKEGFECLDDERESVAGLAVVPHLFCLD